MTTCSPFPRTILTGVVWRGYRSPALRRLLAGVLCGLFVGGAAHANPTGPTVAHGTAQFAGLGASTLDVTSSSNAIINWQGFSIDTGEVTRFIQPSASSAVLNRVTGADPSSILGQLLSNGRVFLVNPHGIVFGEGAVVDTAGLVASTLGISDADFLAGRYRFDAGPDAGGITNQGLIKSGADGVFLLAPNVENSGVIRTDGGDLVLAAGRTITLTSLDLDGVRVDVQAPEDEALNLGELIAERGAAGVFAGSIRNAGTVEANAVTVDENGAIRLVAQGDITLEAGGRVAAEGPSGGEVHIESTSGTTWVSGEVSARASEGGGGTIRLLGNRVGLEGATVDASGPTGGGEVLVGGDESGEGSVPTAQSTYVSLDSTVSADALDDGDGGKVVVFAEGFANVQGRLSARGGPNGGDGGFIETSGLESLEILRTPDTTAANGDGGEWLIDPNDIEIVPGGGDPINATGTNPFESTGDSARLGIDLIIAALSGGQTVTVQTTESGGNSEGGDITLNAPLDIEDTTGTNTLILDAHRHIIIDEAISDTAGGAILNLVFDAEGEVFIDADVALYSGLLQTNAFEVEVSNGAHVIVDRGTWTINAEEISVGDNSLGVVTVRNGGAIEANVDRIEVGASGDGRLNVESGATVKTYGQILIGQDGHTNGDVVVTGSGSQLVAEENRIVVGDSGTGELSVENGAEVAARWVVIGFNAGSDGSVTVTGSGSTLTTAGIDNRFMVGREGNGNLNVLDGGFIDTLDFRVANAGVGRAIISGVAADGTQSRVIVSPANGNFSGVYANEAGFVRVGRNAGSNGRLEIRGGGLLRVLDGNGTHGPQFDIARNKGSVGTVLIDGVGSSIEVIQYSPAVHGNPDVWAGPTAQLGRRGGATTIIRNGGTFLVRGESAFLRVSRDSDSQSSPDPDAGPIDQRSVMRIESAGRMEIDGEGALLAIGDSGPAADGMVTVTGPGSTLVTKGTDNTIRVGDEGTGTLHVLDGGLVEALYIEVGRTGIGRLVIRGVAADGTRSRVIVSPADGRFSEDFVDLSSVVGVGRNAGSQGRLEILEGGLLRILDGDGTHSPILVVARHKGSAGTLVIDGEGSLLEVIQSAPAVQGNPHVAPGPRLLLAWRGDGTTTIRNGGRLLVRGESAFVQVSRDSIFQRITDPDTGPINQASVVRIESGGRMEVDGEGAGMVIGDSGPGADGTVTVTGAGSVLVLTGAGNRLVVGDDGGRGRLEVRDGGAARYGELVVGANGTTNLSVSEEEPPAEEPPAEEPPAQESEEEAQEEIDAVTTDILPEPDVTLVIDEAFEPEVAGEQGEGGEDDDEEEDESGEALGVDEGDEEEQEELPMCAA